MNLALLGLGFSLLLGMGYIVYGRWVARQFVLDDRRPTPAHHVNDGVDYVPTRRFYLFGQHFSAIAAAGPIAGPILACQAWGWVPCVLWIGLGVVLIGAVHDFSSLTASVRHGACTIAEIVRRHLGGRAGTAILLFIWLALIYVIVAFTDITAGTFVAGGEELAGTEVEFHKGGAVAAAAVMYLLLAVVFGFVQRFLRLPLWLSTLIFVPATLLVCWVGTQVSTLLSFDHKVWGLIIIGYCCLASVVPVWSLLQPRGYLGGFVLYFALALGVIGLFFGEFEIQQDAFKTWDAGGSMGMLFPFLFVTIACGACSGFHGLICSGTTSKQVDRETHRRPIGYGAMLAEGFVALIALGTIMIALPAETRGKAAGTIYGDGIGQFFTLLIGSENLLFARTFGAMAFSTFVFDTLDICMRLGRYLIQELMGWRSRWGAAVGTLVTAIPPLYFIWFAPAGSYLEFWTLFGASNQLLAALTLLAITFWLYQARRRIAFTLLPMLFVLTITLWSLTSLTIHNFTAARGLDVKLLNGLAAALLIFLAIFLVATALLRATEERKGSLTPMASIEGSGARR
jgi:carbon starvation protein